MQVPRQENPSREVPRLFGAGAGETGGASSAGIRSGAGAASWSGAGAGAASSAVVGNGTPLASSMSQLGSVDSSIARLGDEFWGCWGGLCPSETYKCRLSAAPWRPVNSGLGDLVLIVTCLYTAVW